MRLPTWAPYETAVLPSRGPPCSFTLTLALNFVIVGVPRTGLRATRSTVSRAAGGGVLKTAARVELLLAGSPNELLPAVPAGQGLVLKAHVGSLQSSRPTSRFHASQGAIPSLGPTREP